MSGCFEFVTTCPGLEYIFAGCTPLLWSPGAVLLARRLVHRDDDTAEKAQVRLDTYYANIAAIKACYEDVTCSLDGARGKNEVQSSHGIRHTSDNVAGACNIVANLQGSSD